MREIKFRAWDKKHKQMEYVGQLHFSHPRCSSPNTIEEICLDKYDTLHDSDNFILMQYTGLKDCDDKEIYEGDIVKCEKFWTRKVEWGEVEDSELGNPIGVGYSDCFECGEIIGNIYENPELSLKE